MRVISGTARGRILLAPKGLDTRPTADRIKESLFNIIAPDIYGACFLDLFAGSGALGVEALSRGARSCVFVESDSAAVGVIRENLARTGLYDMAEVCCLDVYKALAVFAKRNAPFDIIMMDPPYNKAALHMEALTGHIKRLGLLSGGGYVVGEHGAGLELASIANITPLRTRSCGRTTSISFWKPK